MKKVIIGVIVIALVVFAYYTISPFFRNIEVNDAVPDNVIDIVADSNLEAEAQLFDNEGVAKEIQKQGEQDSIVKNGETSDSVTTGENQRENISEEQNDTPKRFSVQGTTGHPASGNVQLLSTTNGTVIRYEDFETINGPNLHVYLSKDLDAKDFVDLGPIKGTKGNINYTVPEGVSLSEYPYVMYWCVPFGVLFNYAEVTP
jgi:hypothetical protein